MKYCETPETRLGICGMSFLIATFDHLIHGTWITPSMGHRGLISQSGFLILDPKEQLVNSTKMRLTGMAELHMN